MEVVLRREYCCALLSSALLVGLAANAALGWWWADPAAALAMVPFLIREGKEGLEGGHHEGENGGPTAK